MTTKGEQEAFDRDFEAVRAEVRKLDINDPGWEDAAIALLTAKGFDVSFTYEFGDGVKVELGTKSEGMTKQ
jgi:hypothetical protein